MKKITILTFILFIFNYSFAQEETTTDNKFVLGGSISISTQNNYLPISSLGSVNSIGTIYSNNTDDFSSSSLSFSPYLGKEINKNVIIGVQLNFRGTSSETKDVEQFGQTETVDFERKTSRLGFGAFTRYIFNPEQKLNFFLQPYVLYNTSKQENYIDAVINYEEQANYINVGVSIGGLYAINDKIRATLRAGLINYVNGSWEVDNSGTKTNFNALSANLNLSSIAFGFEVRL